MSPKIWNHSVWIPITNPKTLKEEFDRILTLATFNVLHFTEHHFEPEGWTALWLLGESHLAIHTFPEHCTSYVELSSCMMDKYVVFLEWLEKLPENLEKGPMVNLNLPLDYRERLRLLQGDWKPK
ncbi:S-adenosylmethionine decarboxylase family protein [Spirosoma foliorum]|uniref:S-adenosylmethionine decarboxylase n=1 Tax=Spirosoma foliorum TaxID=2710596 RepID=A0A7G5H5J3_9BACT|nr:S-adenosylmethionine decarboxylase [Spirosoma foliorum]QMW06385.1 S-adenosylmethionine decarboxylase [Spirosoma foliorum]